MWSFKYAQQPYQTLSLPQFCAVCHLGFSLNNSVFFPFKSLGCNANVQGALSQ